MDYADLIRRQLLRQINERIVGISHACQIDLELLPLCCECGRMRCFDEVVLQEHEFESVRARGVVFFVSPEHAAPVAADVVGKIDGRAVLVATAHGEG